MRVSSKRRSAYQLPTTKTRKNAVDVLTWIANIRTGLIPLSATSTTREGRLIIKRAMRRVIAEANDSRLLTWTVPLSLPAENGQRQSHARGRVGSDR